MESHPPQILMSSVLMRVSTLSVLYSLQFWTDRFRLAIIGASPCMQVDTFPWNYVQSCPKGISVDGCFMLVYYKKLIHTTMFIYRSSHQTMCEEQKEKYVQAANIRKCTLHMNPVYVELHFAGSSAYNRKSDLCNREQKKCITAQNNF